MTSRPPGPVTSARISSYWRSSSVSIARSFAFARCPPYEALTIQGEVLASRRSRSFTPSPISACRQSRCTSGAFDLRWYSLAYLAGIFIGYWYLLKLLKKPGAPMARRHADDLVFYAALGIILGGRIGYVLFYNLGEYLRHPIEILKLWDGGMSFHGGVIGTSLGIFYLARKEKLSWLRIHDYVACCVPFGLFFGRLANFVNQELWGAHDPCRLGDPLRGSERSSGNGSSARRATRARLYEAVLEGIVLFAILAWMFWKTEARYQPGKLVGAFLFFYGCFRFGDRVHPRAGFAAHPVRADDPPAHGPMAVGADDPRRALPDVTAKSRRVRIEARRVGHRERRADAARARASRANSGRGADHRRSLYGSLQRLLLRDARPVRAGRRFRHRARRSARCSAR